MDGRPVAEKSGGSSSQEPGKNVTFQICETIFAMVRHSSCSQIPLMSLPLHRGVLFLALAAFAVPVMAQSDDAAPPPPPHRGRAEQRIKELKAKLGLTDAQVEQIKTILKGQMQAMRDIREDDSLSDDDRRAKLMALMKSSHDQVRAILTPDQQKIFDAMPSTGMGRHHGGPDGPPPPDGDAPPAPPPST